MSKKLLVALCMCLCASSSALAQDAAPAPAVVDAEVLEVNDLANPEDVKNSEQAQDSIDAEDIVRDLIDNYCYDKNIQLGLDPNSGKYFASSIQMVSVNSADAEFSKRRVLAYEKAYTKALKEYASFLGESFRTETVRDFYLDNSSGEPFPEELAQGKGTFTALFDKTIALGDAIVSEKLQAFGIDPTAFNSSPPDQRKQLMRDALQKNMVSKIAENFAGVTPIQNFVGKDAKGNQAVGVIILFSPKLKAVAQSLHKGQQPAMQVKGRSLREQIPLNNPKELHELLGTRILFDEHGPVIVSYGQWASSYKGNDNIRASRFKQAAFSQAEALAKSQLSEFLNTNFISSSKNDVGEVVEDAAIKSGATGEVSSESTDYAVDVVNEHAKRSSSNLLRGVTSLKSWTYTTPEGHRVVGVVKVLSFRNIEASKAANRPARPTAPKANSNPQQGQSSSSQSMDQMDLDVF